MDPIDITSTLPRSQSPGATTNSNTSSQLTLESYNLNRLQIPTPVSTSTSTDSTRMDSSLKGQINDVLNVTAAPNTGSQKPTSPARKPYLSQFSSSASLVLSRLRDNSKTTNGDSSNKTAHNGSFNQLIKEEIITNTSQPLSDTRHSPTPDPSKTNLTLPLPPGPISTSPSSLTSGVKRKRSAPVESVDFTQNTVAFPWSGTSANTPASGQRQLRKRTSEGNGDAEGSPRLRSKVPRTDNDGLEKLRQKRLEALPRNVVPAKPELVGFGAGRSSGLARINYFSNMKKTDLLNILSFCDQLKPQLLVDILVSVTIKHPNLPIFNAPDWDSRVAARPARPEHQKPRHGHVLLNKARPRPNKATKKILKRTRVIEVVADLPGEDADVLPPTWAKANEGLYGKLLPETEDRLFLLDENDEESFSHFLVDSFGKQIVELVGA